MKQLGITALLATLCLLFGACAPAAEPTVMTTTTMTTTTTTTAPPIVKVERRAVWVSLYDLADIFAPCKTLQQAQEAVDTMMDTVVEHKMNTVFFHVRAGSDAYYSSALFSPASAVKELLMQGFDPLHYAVEAAHKRGIELHAWINPYRIGKNKDRIVGDAATMKDETGRYYYVPTAASAQRLILDGVREVLDNYDVDGIQYDDYFYPENFLKADTVYDFEKTDYAAYQQAGGTLSVGDWRRAAVDALVAATHTLTKAADVTFGISPSHNVDKTYNGMYADSKKWLAQSGYVDYVCPQIYVGFENETAAFAETADTWANYPRDPSVDLYVGLALYKIGLKDDTWAGDVGRTEWQSRTDVMMRSVTYAREKGYDGLCFYSFSFLTPDTCNIAEFPTKNDKTVAKQEMEHLLAVL
ncbi:MAG: family 10 glycosylhydrolase [Clostridia bacterium]|nr:family 10 glycosylhydrolase [Clostridia bacterium]